VSGFQRLFLTVEGEHDAYPNYKSATVHLTTEDPAMLCLQNLFITSPIFSPYKDGTIDLPRLESNTKITFLMVPTIFPAFNEILTSFSFTNEIWFTLGLANLVIIDNSAGKVLTEKIIKHFAETNNLTASESWTLNEKQISKTVPPVSKNYKTNSEVYHCKLNISETLPLHLKFAISEYIISIDKFLTASKKFTPHYFESHEKTILASNDLISDLAFLHGDENVFASDAILTSLEANNQEQASEKLTSEIYKEVIDELINDWHGKIIQFNSSMSYIYSQAYSGTFPIFDHIGIIRRHSLLGVGSAIGSLYELLQQLEKVFYRLPFDDLSVSPYKDATCPEEYKQLIIDPSLFNSHAWTSDSVKSKVVGTELSHVSQKFPDDFFHRLSFFSGRLGFREYELSATAAIQVLVESHKLQWHIINYTHEIIHNHVRMILNQLLVDLKTYRYQESDSKISFYMNVIEHTLDSDSNPIPITYADFFITTLLKFIINANIYGSLNSPANAFAIDECMASLEKRLAYSLPDAPELQENMLLYYKDITEIFVHVIDYCYIYKQQTDIYLMSIWASWSTIPAVANDIKQYIMRSLIVIGLTIDGSVDKRFIAVIAQFKELLNHLKAKHRNFMYDRILSLINDTDQYDDLKLRFYNCMIVGDLVYNFFVGKLETLLDNKDKNTLPKGSVDENGNPKLYYVQRNSFEGEAIDSKVRFLLDQLSREIYTDLSDESDECTEKTSAWLLLTLSSIN
jgi:hypothetical protein